MRNEVDDRLAGDPVWELFPDPATGPARGSPGSRDYRRWLAVACLVAVVWLVSPSFAAATLCLAVAFRDFRTGRQLARSIPDKAGGTVCARFTYAWGAWKFGVAAFVLMFATVTVFTAGGGERVPPSGFVVSMLLWLGGFTASAALTASGLLRAYRSGMRVWIGEGVNQARTLLLGMLIVGFAFVVLGPMTLWLAEGSLRPSDGQSVDILVATVGFFGSMFGAPFVLLLILDRISRRIVADRPGKFGPKVPAVGKWNS
jgi:hypothetical protein